MEDTLILIYCPFPTADSARAAAQTLLGERHAACCTLLPAAESHYWWEGTLTTSTEVILLAKTSLAGAAALSTRLGMLHPYACPAILQLEASCNAAFAQWLGTQLAAPDPA